MGGTEADRYQRCPDLTQTQVRIAKPTQLHSEYTLFFNKNVFFPAQTEYSYSSANFKLKIF